jgi:hypothetical protein
VWPFSQLPIPPTLAFQEISMNASQPEERPDIPVFPDLNMVIRTPAGREYRGKVLEHPSQHAKG